MPNRPDGCGNGGVRATLPPRRRGWRPRPGRGNPAQPLNAWCPGTPTVPPPLARSRTTLPTRHLDRASCLDRQPGRKNGVVPVTGHPVRPQAVPGRRRISVAQLPGTDQGRTWSVCPPVGGVSDKGLYACFRADRRRRAAESGLQDHWPARYTVFRMGKVALGARPASPYPGRFTGVGGKSRGNDSFKELTKPSGGNRMQRQVLCTAGMS